MKPILEPPADNQSAQSDEIALCGTCGGSVPTLAVVCSANPQAYCAPADENEAQVCTCGTWDGWGLGHDPACAVYVIPPASTDGGDRS